MSNKGFDKLNILDQKIRRAKPVGMTDSIEVKLTIQLICGFELFNTRPYHNYETWSNGYRVFDDDIQVEAEDLDEAIDKFIAALDDPKPHHRRVVET